MAEMIRKTIATHGLWRMMLKAAIQTGYAGDLRPSKVARAPDCKFSVWLEGLPQEARHTPRALEVQRVHAEFHRAAAEVLEHALERRVELATHAIDRGAFASSLAQLNVVLCEWERELAVSGFAA